MTQQSIEEVAADVAALKRAEDIRSGRIQTPDRAEFLQACANAQAHKFLVRRARAERGHEARERALRATSSQRLKLEDRLAKVERERQGALEKHDAQRRQLREHFNTLAEKPRAALEELQAQVQAAGKAAEDALDPHEIPTPTVRLGVDRSDTPPPEPQRWQSAGGWR